MTSPSMAMGSLGGRSSNGSNTSHTSHTSNGSSGHHHLQQQQQQHPQQHPPNAPRETVDVILDERKMYMVQWRDDATFGFTVTPVNSNRGTVLLLARRTSRRAQLAQAGLEDVVPGDMLIAIGDEKVYHLGAENATKYLRSVRKPVRLTIQLSPYGDTSSSLPELAPNEYNYLWEDGPLGIVLTFDLKSKMPSVKRLSDKANATVRRDVAIGDQLIYANDLAASEYDMKELMAILRAMDKPILMRFRKPLQDDDLVEIPDLDDDQYEFLWEYGPLGLVIGKGRNGMPFIRSFTGKGTSRQIGMVQENDEIVMVNDRSTRTEGFNETMSYLMNVPKPAVLRFSRRGAKARAESQPPPRTSLPGSQGDGSDNKQRTESQPPPRMLEDINMQFSYGSSPPPASPPAVVEQETEAPAEASASASASASAPASALTSVSPPTPSTMAAEQQRAQYLASQQQQQQQQFPMPVTMERLRRQSSGEPFVERARGLSTESTSDFRPRASSSGMHQWPNNMPEDLTFGSPSLPPPNAGFNSARSSNESVSKLELDAAASALAASTTSTGSSKSASASGSADNDALQFEDAASEPVASAAAVATARSSSASSSSAHSGSGSSSMRMVAPNDDPIGSNQFEDAAEPEPVPVPVVVKPKPKAQAKAPPAATTKSVRQYEDTADLVATPDNQADHHHQQLTKANAKAKAKPTQYEDTAELLAEPSKPVRQYEDTAELVADAPPAPAPAPAPAAVVPAAATPSTSPTSAADSGADVYAIDETAFYHLQWTEGPFGSTVREAESDRGSVMLITKRTGKQTCKGLRRIVVGDLLVRIGDKNVWDLSFDKATRHLRKVPKPVVLTFQAIED